jgi:short-subunit dehydrogenase
MIKPTGRQFALITGASLGLGRSLACKLAEQGYHLLLVALPDAALAETTQHINSNYQVEIHMLGLDLTRPDAPKTVADWARTYPVAILVNNAGFGGTLVFEQAAPEHIDKMLMLNVRTTALLCRLIIPMLLAQPQSYIVNVSSIAAFNPSPYKTVYPASKAFITALSQSLWIEYRHRNLHVLVVHPGPMPTSDEILQRLANWGWVGRQVTRTPEQVAQLILQALARRRMMVMPGRVTRLLQRFSRLIPLRYRLHLAYRMVGKELTDKIPHR